MNKSFALLFFLMTNISVHSQNEIKNDSLIIQAEIRKDSLVIKQEIHKEVFVEPTIHQEWQTTTMGGELNRSVIENNSATESPNDLSYKLELYPELKMRKLSSKLSYSLNEYNYNYGVGNFRQGGIELFYKPLDRVTISMGEYVANYNILHSRYNDIVFNFNATYEITDWMFLTFFGQYSVNSTRTTRYGGYMFSPQTSYGTTLKFKTSEKVDFNIGVERSFNSMSKQWETSGILRPSIRLK